MTQRQLKFKVKDIVWVKLYNVRGKVTSINKNPLQYHVSFDWPVRDGLKTGFYRTKWFVLEKDLCLMGRMR